MNLSLFDHNASGAHFSDCRKYRYALWRIWDESKPLVMFIGLNPSTANEVRADPTIRKVQRLVENWEYGGFYMMNLFAFVTPYPEQLETGDPIGENNNWLQQIAQKCEKVICAWGAFGFSEREQEVKDMFPEAYALVINKDGSPRHPLYVKGDTIPVRYLTQTTTV